MNTTTFGRLLWKEYRQQRAFWLASGLIILMIIGLTSVVESFVYEKAVDFYYLAEVLALSFFYVLGCGAMLFAGENEAGTFEFQRCLPVTAGKVFLAKVVFAVVAIAALVGVLSLPAVLLDQSFGHVYRTNTRGHVTWYECCAFISYISYIFIIALMWAILFSLLLKRVLLATFLAAVVGIFCSVGGRAVLRYTILPQKGLIAVTIFLVGDLVLLLLANIWLGRRWFCGPSVRIERFWAGWGWGDMALDPASDENMQPARTAVTLRRLIWQQWRFSRLLMGVYVLGYIVLFGLLSALVFRKYHPGAWHEFFLPTLYAYTFYLYCFISSLFGTAVFHGDQKGYSTRFLAQRAADPRHVWLSRVIVWAAPLLAVWFCFFAYYVFEGLYIIVDNGPNIADRTTWYQTVWWVLVICWHHILLWPASVFGVIAIIFAAGQLCSMLFRSGLLAVVFGLGLGGLCTAWIALMMWLGAGQYWSVLPIAVGFLAATWLYAPDWMRERSGWRPYVRPAAAALAPILAVMVIIPFYRVYSIPGGGPGFDVAAYSRPVTADEKKTLAMYDQACEQMEPSNICSFDAYLTQKSWSPKGSERQWWDKRVRDDKPLADKNQKAIRLAMAASRRESCGQFVRKSGKAPPTVTLACLLVADGNRLTVEGKLDAAAERYFAALRVASHLGRGTSFHYGEIIESQAYDGLRYWSAAPGQTTEQIKSAISEIDAIAAKCPPRDEAVKAFHMQMRSTILDEEKFWEYALSGFANYWLKAQWYSLPWERARLLRMLDLATADDLESLKNMSDPYFYDKRERAMRPSSESLLPLMDYSIRENRCFFGGTAEISGIFGQIAFYELNIRTERRATKIILALEAWRLEHGELPASLDELVGPYFQTLPQPPGAGTVFAYFPKGLPIRLFSHPSGSGIYGKFERTAFRPNWPLLLVCDWQYAQTGGQEAIGDDCAIGARYNCSTVGDLLNDGFAFPIP